MKRRILTLLLTLVMVLSLLPGTALAVNDSSAPAVTYADLADINGTALVPDGAGENTELTVADAVRALLLWTGMPSSSSARSRMTIWLRPAAWA